MFLTLLFHRPWNSNFDFLSKAFIIIKCNDMKPEHKIIEYTRKVIWWMLLDIFHLEIQEWLFLFPLQKLVLFYCWVCHWYFVGFPLTHPGF